MSEVIFWILWVVVGILSWSGVKLKADGYINVNDALIILFIGTISGFGGLVPLAAMLFDFTKFGNKVLIGKKK